MAACLSRSVGLPPVFPGSASSLKTMQMDDHSGENGSRAPVSVLRRTLSAAEMCSKMLKPHSGGGIKKTSSVENLHSMIRDKEDGNGSGSGKGSGSEALEAIWSSIQKKSVAEESEKTKTKDLWGSILSEKDDVAPAPYVHPLVKRSASSLSEKSLEICTESLGSETGAEVFTFPESDKDLIGNDFVAVTEVDETMNQKPNQVRPTVEVQTVTRSKRTVAPASGSFPPPLPSLGNRDDGSNVQMRCHRQDGRLVVEAVSVLSRNCFKAERQGGRLLLTFSGEESPATENDVSDNEEDEEESSEELDEEEEEVAPVEDQREMGMMKYVDYKFLFLTRSLNKVVPTTDNVAEKMTWTPTPKEVMNPEGGTLINPYVYSWRSKEMVPRGGATVAEEGGYGGCNGNLQETPPRGKSLLFWPNIASGRCIATS